MTEKYISQADIVSKTLVDRDLPVTHTRQLTRYDTGYESRPEWSQMQELFKQLDFSDNTTERANQVVGHFLKGSDVVEFIQTIHHYAVPDTVTEELRHQSFSVDEEGGRTSSFAMPEERPFISMYAVRQIQELAQMRVHGNELADQVFLGASADILALTTIYRHSFNDGNGRSSRIAAQLIRNGASDEDCMKVLSSSRRDQPYDIEGYVPKDINMYWAKMLEALAMKDLSLSDIEGREKRRNQLITAPTTMIGGTMLVKSESGSIA